MKLAQYQLEYTTDASRYFAPLAALPGAIWLDSANSAQGLDLLSAQPHQQWIQWPDHAEFAKEKIACTPLTALPLLIAQQQQFYGNITQPQAPGLMGFLSYDFGLAAHGLEVKKDDITFPLAEIGFYTWHMVIDHQQQHAALYYYERYHKLADLLALLQTKPIQQKPLTLTSAFASDLSADEYQRTFATIQQHLLAGDCYQVNFAQRFQAQAHGSAWQSYQQLRVKHPHPYAGYAHTGHGDILCLSPEAFIGIDAQQRISTRPIKGTQPRHADAAEDQRLAQQLLNSEKDRAENIMIVDLLRNDLGQVCEAGSVEVTQLCQLHSFAAVHHLISEVQGQLRQDIHPLQALNACFPGGSITGAPKRQAMQIIQQLEKHQRHIFCGSLFALTADQQLFSNICIRTLLYQAPHLYCWAGGGIVFDSNWQNEYAEADWKVGRLLKDIAEINR
jgi:para-aminobenzoate synthetase component 1